jgi:hypothetical protein
LAKALLMIVADKPAESWTDADVTVFEVRLGDLARRFKNLEALQKEVAAHNQGGFEARRITITRPDGGEINRMVWMNYEQQAQVDPLVEKILADCSDLQLQQALLTRLTERILEDAELPIVQRSEVIQTRGTGKRRHVA